MVELVTVSFQLDQSTPQETTGTEASQNLSQQDKEDGEQEHLEIELQKEGSNVEKEQANSPEERQETDNDRKPFKNSSDEESRSSESPEDEKLMSSSPQNT